MRHPSILKRFEAVPSWRPPHELRQSVSTGINVEDGNQVAHLFPFASQDSLNICVESALEIINSLTSLRNDLHSKQTRSKLSTRAVTKESSVAPFACSALLAGYTLMMISFFQSHSPEQGVCAISVAELQGRCKYGVNASITSLEHFAVGFDFIKLLKGMLFLRSFAVVGEWLVDSTLHRSAPNCRNYLRDARDRLTLGVENDFCRYI